MAVPDIKAVIFDCFGVIYSGNTQTLISLCPEEKVEELKNVNRQYDHGWLTHDDFIEALARIIGKSTEEIREYIKNMHVRDEMLVSYIRELKSSGYKVGLLSNVGETTIEKLFTASELSGLFDDVLLSYKVHVVKPDPAIFTMEAERLELAPGECVMIDDVQENIDGAIAAGMQAVKYDDLHQLKRDLAALLKGDDA